jgi:hypothetical protein
MMAIDFTHWPMRLKTKSFWLALAVPVVVMISPTPFPAAP